MFFGVFLCSLVIISRAGEWGSLKSLKFSGTCDIFRRVAAVLKLGKKEPPFISCKAWLVKDRFMILRLRPQSAWIFFKNGFYHGIHHHQTTIWENMFYILSWIGIFMQIQKGFSCMQLSTPEGVGHVESLRFKRISLLWSLRTRVCELLCNGTLPKVAGNGVFGNLLCSEIIKYRFWGDQAMQM